MNSQFEDFSQTRIAVIGLGYVGLPLAVEFGRRYSTVGFDIDAARVSALKSGLDRTLEVAAEELSTASELILSSDPVDLHQANTFIATVPTPIDGNRNPDLEPLKAASRLIGQAIAPGGIAIFESTVFPGATEEVCVPIIEEVSGLKLNEDFYAGYSPERINPGDHSHRLGNIVKVTSGSTVAAADFVDRLYASIVPAGTHRASSIRVAEAAKIIENTQRDLNIALVNELALIFDRLGIDTTEVLEAAGTKWNFLPFRPGLVGGHCIGVDPYYLTYKAEQTGYHPEIILAGRRINDQMGKMVADRLVKLMTRAGINVVGSRALILGLAFKENCPDVRNSRVVDVVEALKAYNVDVDVHDPWVSADQAENEHGIALVHEPPEGAYDAVVLAVAHRDFLERGAGWIEGLAKSERVIFDVKSALPRSLITDRL